MQNSFLLYVYIRSLSSLTHEQRKLFLRNSMAIMCTIGWPSMPFSTNIQYFEWTTRNLNALKNLLAFNADPIAKNEILAEDL